MARHKREVIDDEIEARDEAPSAEDRLASTDDQSLVREALDALDEDRRSVLVLHDVDGIAMPQLAIALSLPLNTAYSRLRLARKDFLAAAQRIRARRGER